MANLQTVSNSAEATRFWTGHPIRIIAIAAAGGVAGCLLYWNSNIQIGTMAAWQVAGALYTAVIGISALVVFRFFPDFGPFLEYTSISRLILASASVVAPEFARALTASPFLNATLIVLGAMLIRAAVRAERNRRQAPGIRHGKSWRAVFPRSY